MESTKIQNFLPLGYLFLVVLGILKESVIYYQLGIPILKYSSIFDILISPIATITSSVAVLLAVVVFFYLCSKIPDFLMNNYTKKWVQHMFAVDLKKFDMPKNELKNYLILNAIQFLGIFLLSFFLGFGLADGYSTAEKIKKNNLTFDYKLNFSSGEAEVISLINSNTSYYFYVVQGNQNICIAPVGAIKNLELINNSKLKELKTSK